MVRAEENFVMQMARMMYPNEEIISAHLDEGGVLHLEVRLNEPVRYIQFSTELNDEKS